MSGPDDDFADDGAAYDADVRAGEYVLGVLDAREAAQVRRDAMRDLDLADAIVRWEVRLSPLTPGSGIAPPRELWTRIDATLGREGAVGAIGPRGRGAARGAGPWRVATLASLALAAAFAAVAFVPRAAPPAQLAVLLPTNATSPAFVAQAREGSVILTAFQPAAVPTSRDLQLWLLAPGVARPVSLGLLPSSGRTVVLPGPQPNGAQLLVSLEPQGGSPTGQPTGPVLYGGALRPS